MILQEKELKENQVGNAIFNQHGRKRPGDLAERD